MRFVATTVARTLVVVVTLGLLAVGYLVLYRLPRERARDEWTRCVKPHVAAAERAQRSYDYDASGAALEAAKVCGPAPQ
jgi:hypothetical protein